MDDGLRFEKQKNRRLTTDGDDAIITTGRDDAFGWALSLCCGEAAYQLALDGGLLFLLLVVVIATKLDRFEHKRDCHYDYRNNFEVSHDLTPFNLRIQR